jgi:site-specific DNA recombinase
MKLAYAYGRISDDDQSNFSIPGQQKMIEDYCLKHNIKLVKFFTDDGYSAKNFQRPSWKELEQELSKNKSRVDYLIVWKYDRLIRNATQGLVFIEKLEQKWNIKLLSVMENFFIDPHSPYFFKMRADLLVTAEFERRVISDRTKFGVWSAKSQGRFIGRAPLGYKNERDEKDLPILMVNPEQKPVVEQIFNDYLNDVPNQVIKQKVNAQGITFKGHDAIPRIVTNHVYAGLIQTPNYKDDVAKVVKGIHQPIIPEEVFWKAYYKYQGTLKPQGPKIVDENVPLRGFILCQGCGGVHTGGKSKGRSAHYYYYRCKKCQGENYSAEKVHEEIGEILKHLSLNDRLVGKLISQAELKLKQARKDKETQLKKATSDFTTLTEKLSSLEEKFIANKISQETYEKWYPVYSKEVNLKNIELSDLKKDSEEGLKLFKSMIPNLTKLQEIYAMAKDVDKKQAFLKGIFWGGFTKEKVGGRTGMINPMFYSNSLKINTLLRVQNEGKPENISGFPFCTRKGT